LQDNPTLRYACIGLAIGLFFIMFKIAMMRFSADPEHHERGAEKLYYNGSDYFASTVILISLDGFRPDYLNRGKTPHMKEFGECLNDCMYLLDTNTNVQRIMASWQNICTQHFL